MHIRFFNPVANLLVFFVGAYFLLAYEVIIIFGANGVFSSAFATMPALKIGIGLVLLAHVTITSMSLSFHRQHTHQGVALSPGIDRAMQVWLWMTTSMSKLDWVSVHIYHHAHSDGEKDVHSPKQSGFWKVFFLGAYMYTQAKNDPEVLRIRRKLPQDGFERFLAENLFLGPILWVVTMTILFGVGYGIALSLGTFVISPLFAVGGVNALAHHVGYRNYQTTDESRNIGWLFPLNWIICGELDHNNHHAHPKSCRFSHRWYEFDVGYAYLKLFSWFGLAELKHVRSKVS